MKDREGKEATDLVAGDSGVDSPGLKYGQESCIAEGLADGL